MLVHFTTASSYTLDDLKRLIGTEGVGYDPDFHSYAALFYAEGGELRGLEAASALVIDDAKREEWGDLADSPVWCTARSGFVYQLIGHEDDFSDILRPRRRDVWCYDGARRGFLTQNLLMPLPDVRISWVRGTFGEFTGDDAFETYGAVANAGQRLAEAALAEDWPHAYTSPQEMEAMPSYWPVGQSDLCTDDAGQFHRVWCRDWSIRRCLRMHA